MYAQPEHEAGEHEPEQAVLEQPEVAVEQRVDRVEAGDMIRRVDARR